MKMFLFLLLAVTLIGVERAAPPPPVYQAGTAVLHFNGGTVALTQVDFAPGFQDNPVLVCSASNEHDAGVRVACQSLTNEMGGVSAVLDYNRDIPLIVNWIAVEATTP